MIIGPGKSGKTTLAAWLEDSSDIRRVQNMVYRKNTLDTPGAYLESPWMHHHLIAAAQDASCVVMTADAKGKREVYPPGFAKSLPRSCHRSGHTLRPRRGRLQRSGTPADKSRDPAALL